jgi:hypothetical protein
MEGKSLYKTSSLMGKSPEINRRYAALSPGALVDPAEFGPPQELRLVP